MTSLAQIDRYRPRWRAKRSGWLILVLLNGIAESLSHAQTAEPTPPGPVHQVLQDHCWKCHDAETAKGRLSLEQTPARFAETHLQDRWTRVFDRIARHEMPPTNQPALGREDRELLLGWLQENLTQSSREHQLREGRSPLRRLSRNEYAHAVNDLFGLRVEVLDLLPEDTRVAGFDKLTRGLDISSQHWLRYQQAAHRVVEAAFPDRPPNSKRSYQTGRQWLEQQRRRGGKSAELALKYGAQVEGNSVTLYAQSLSHPYLQLEVGMPSEPGRYRLRGSVRARGHGGQPLPLLILLTGYNPIEDPTLQRVVDVKDIPEAAAPRIIDLEILVPHFSERWKTQSVALAGWSLPQQPQLGALEAQAVLGQPPDFSGPGITVEWVEFEGPLGSATSPGNRPLITALPDANPAASAEELVGRLARHLLRRPLSDEVTAEYRRYFAQQLERGGSASQAAKFTCEAMLCSPHFLFRQEAPGRLDHAASLHDLPRFSGIRFLTKRS